MSKIHTHNESKLELCESYVDSLNHMYLIISGLSDPTPEVENILVEMQEVLGKAVNRFSSLTDDLIIFAMDSEHNEIR